METLTIAETEWRGYRLWAVVGSDGEVQRAYQRLCNAVKYVAWRWNLFEAQV